MSVVQWTVPVTFRQPKKKRLRHLDSDKEFSFSLIVHQPISNCEFSHPMCDDNSLFFTSSHLNQQMEFDLNKVIFQTHFSSHKFPRTLIIYTSSPSNSNAQRSCSPFADLIYWQDWRRRANFAPKGCLQLSSRLHLVFIIQRNLVECLHAQGNHVSCYMWENLLRFIPSCIMSSSKGNHECSQLVGWCDLAPQCRA